MALITKYKAGDKISYLDNVYTVCEEIFIVKNITDLDKQIRLNLISETGEPVISNVWKSDYGMNPNIFIDKNTNQYKLAEIDVDSKVVFVGFRYDYNGSIQFNQIGGYKLLDDKEVKLKSAVDVLKLKDNITQLIDKIKNEPLKQTCTRVYQEYYDELISKPAANKNHHAYVGGLLQHTAEVMLCAYNMSQPFKVNTDYIIVASFMHDIMKIKEYSDTGVFQEYGNRIGHVVGSADVFKEYAKMYDVSNDDIDAIYHCILAHHGKKEWGSPVEPNTPEAVIIHEADMVSAGINRILNMGKDGSKDYYLK